MEVEMADQKTNAQFLKTLEELTYASTGEAWVQVF
jgi:hypothetical protein